jgi:dipeptidase D
MTKVLEQLQPARVWAIFEELCAIPRPSKHEQKVVEYVRSFGERLGLETIVDHAGNVIIRKPASPGMENRRGIILQGHLDMVPQKNNDTAHDFLNDPITPVVDGEWVRAAGTTLGADNGIGVAAAMAILQDNTLEHGPLECLFTIDEETGMTGAFELKGGLLKGDILINLDSEDEGELYIGCAGGIDTIARFDFQKMAVPGGMVAYEVTVKGLRGGHSGLDIHLGRGNANKILNRLLWMAQREYGLQLASIKGGSLRNAIPREATATVVLPVSYAGSFESMLVGLAETLTKELGNADPGVRLLAEKTAMPERTFTEKDSRTLFNAVYGCPNGAMRMVTDMPEVVETSTNLAIISSANHSITIESLQRSSVDSAKEDLCQMIRSVFELAGATVENKGAYPGWKPDVHSPILKTMKDVYQQMAGRMPAQKVIHAGLECGILASNYPHLDMISFGPTIRNPHSPDEKVKIDTVGRFYDFLLETLKHAPLQ